MQNCPTELAMVGLLVVIRFIRRPPIFAAEPWSSEDRFALGVARLPLLDLAFEHGL
jgi:hypothetical protein